MRKVRLGALGDQLAAGLAAVARRDELGDGGVTLGAKGPGLVAVLVGRPPLGPQSGAEIELDVAGREAQCPGDLGPGPGGIVSSEGEAAGLVEDREPVIGARGPGAVLLLAAALAQVIDLGHPASSVGCPDPAGAAQIGDQSALGFRVERFVSAFWLMRP